MTPDGIELYYKTKLSYPATPEIPESLKLQLKYKNIVNYPKIKEFDTYVEQTYKETSCEYKDWKNYKAAIEKFNNDREAYREDEAKKLAQFRQDALEECGLLNHPKASKIYSFAWEHGHSSGLYDVLYWLTELADLVNDCTCSEAGSRNCAIHQHYEKTEI